MHDPQSAKLEAGTADGGLPEVVPYSDKEPVHSSVAADRSPQVIRKRRQKWIIIALVIFVVVAAAVGGGVGGALSARSNSASSQTDTSSPNSTATTPANASATACNNAGMQYAIYTNQPYVNDDTVFSKFRPGYFKTQKPFYNGTTNSIGLSVTTVPFFVQNISLYGSPTFNSSAFAVDHRAYLFAREAGTYIFTSNQADAVFYLWVGEENGVSWAQLPGLFSRFLCSQLLTTSLARHTLAGRTLPSLFATTIKDPRRHTRLR